MATNKYKDKDGRVCYILLAKRVKKNIEALLRGKETQATLSNADISAFKEYVRNGSYAFDKEGMLEFRRKHPACDADSPMTLQVQAVLISSVLYPTFHREWWERVKGALEGETSSSAANDIALFKQVCLGFWSKASTFRSRETMLEFVNEQLEVYDIITKGA